MNFFKTKPRTPPDLVRGLRDAIPKLDAGPPGNEARRKVGPPSSPRFSSPHRAIVLSRRARKSRGISKRSRASSTATVVRTRFLSAPSPPTHAAATEPVPELIAQLAQETYSTDLLLILVQNIARFDFESRKDVVQIFSNLLRRQIGARLPTVEYICARHEDVIFAALAGYANEEIALNTGMILREMLRHEQLAKILLHSEQ